MMGRSYRVAGAAMAAMLMVALAQGPADQVAAAAPTKGALTMVARHPWAAAQPTAMGHEIVELAVHDGLVWAGYGDYASNTGPIVLAAHDPQGSAGFDAVLTVDTEALYNLRSVNGALVAPATDPRSAADFAIGAPWQQRRPLGATHVFDSTTLTGTDLWMVGSEGSDAVAWRSLDGGQTWAESLRVSPDSDASDAFNRFYFAAVLDGRLIVQAHRSHGGAEPMSHVFDGTAWSEGPSLLSAGGLGWEPEPFMGGLVYLNSGQGRAGSIYYFDGTAPKVIGVGYDLAVADGELWTLGTAGEVTKTSNLKRWQKVATAPDGARSLAVSDGSAFFGTASSELWRLDLPSKGRPAR